MLHFVDTSALIKLFIQEPGSSEMESFITDHTQHNLVVSAITELEAQSALNRLFREGLMSESELSSILDDLHREIRRMVVQPMSEEVLENARGLISRHFLRPLDAMQCGSAMVSRGTGVPGSVRFVASDRALLRAAEGEGFSVWDPSGNER